MLANELISVIIPVYNVETYLQKCIDSVLNQTYKNLEIILVDDGSPDKCPQICDTYATKDSRIKVIHKKNGGLSSARNAGITKSTGTYIYFLDSDDFISTDCIEILYENLIKENADISIAKFINISENEEIELPAQNENTYTTFSKMESLYKTIYKDHYIEFAIACNKLYKSSIFEKIRFPEGKFHEDEYTSWKTCLECNKVVFSNKITYFYLQRKDSITGQNFSYKTFDYIDAIKERLEYFKDDETLFPYLTKFYRTSLRDKYYMTMRKIKNKENWPYTEKDILKMFRNSFKEYPISIDKKNYSFKELLGLYLFKFSPIAYILKNTCKLFIKKTLRKENYNKELNF